jgi:hypothetical protein
MAKAKLSRPASQKSTPGGVANAIAVAGVSRRGKFPTRDSSISAHSPKNSPTLSPPADVRPPPKGVSDADQRLRDMCEYAVPGKCYTLEQIAQTIGVTRERVRQIEFTAIKRVFPKFNKIFKDDGISLEEVLQTLRAPHDNRSDPGMEDS